MKLKPLKQWICDTCREVIASPADGALEWLEDDDGRPYDFRIVHHLPASPRRETKPDLGCYGHSRNPGSSQETLRDFVGPDGLAHLLMFIDIGQIDPDNVGPHAKDAREVAELMRRTQVQHYEEARQYWREAEKDGLFSDANQISPYKQDTLKDIITRYAEAVSMV